MTPRHPIPAHRRSLFGAICILLFAVVVNAKDYGKLTEEFHHTYPLGAGGRVELDNINGAVHITAWDKDEVKVDAVKSANTKERMDEAEIEIDNGSGYVSISTRYHDHTHSWDSDGWNNPASVEYTLTVPRNARLDEIKLINGPLDIHGVAGEVRASCINGKMTVQGLQGRTKLDSVNSRMDVQVDRLGTSPVELSSVNGSIMLTLPSDAKAEVEASTVSGSIEDDFGLHVNNHRYVGHDLRGELGSGGPRIELSNVNGRIEIRHANDGRTLSTVKDLSSRDRDDDKDDDDDEI